MASLPLAARRPQAAAPGLMQPRAGLRPQLQAHAAAPTRLASLDSRPSLSPPLPTHRGQQRRQRTAVVPQAARGVSKAAAAAAAAAAQQHQALVSQLFAASTVYALAVAALMAFAPRWSVTRRLVRSPLVLAPLGLVYGLLLAWSWQPDALSLILPGSWAEGLKGGWNPQFMPSLDGICTLFSRWATAASLWVHLLAVNTFAAREAYLEGELSGVPTWHSILLCMTLAPLGLLSHAVTKAAWGRLRRA